ncbi:DNA repair protein XRCC2 isoform X2 [Chaetodon auriga]
MWCPGPCDVPLQAVQMIQDSEGTVGVRRREVGCQSDSAERRDAAVQVDLLTQELSCRHCPGVCSGVLWQCVSVRADEAGGGALLRHCSSQETHTLNTEQHTHASPPLYLLCSPLRHTLLPTMPLFRPPAPPTALQSKELQRTTWLPSMPQCDPRPLLPRADVSAPPPGLIAPLSPRLAEEEEEEEEEEGSLQHENNESLWSDQQSAVTAEKKKKRRKAGWSDSGDHSCNTWGETSRTAKLTNHITGGVQPNETTHSSTARRDSEMSDGERCLPNCRQGTIQSEDRSSIQTVRDEIQRGETWQHCRKRGIQTGRPAARIQHTRADGGQHKTIVKEEEEEEEEEEEREKQLLGEEEGGPKRRCTKEQRNDELMVKEEAEEGGRPRRTTVGPPIRYLVESEERSDGLSAANHSKAREAKVKRKLGRLSREHGEEEEEKEQERRGGVELTKWTDSSRKESSEDEGVDAGWQLCQVCGLTFACRSSLQLHLSGHRAGCRLSCTNSLRLHRCSRHHHSARAADDKQHEEANANNDREQKETQQRSKEDKEKTLLPASTKAPDWSRHRRRVCRNPRWWVDYRTTMKKRLDTDRWRRRQEIDGGRERRTKRCREEEEEMKAVCLKEDNGGEEGERRGRRDGGKEEEEEEKKEEKEEVEQPQRPRRKMVGPPIRYLLESEELSYRPLTANQYGAKGFKQGRKPQKKSKAGAGASGDTAVIDRPEDTEHTERQAGQTVTERQTGHMIPERQTGQTVTKTQTGHMFTERQTGHIVTETQTGHMFTERQAGQTVTEREKTLLPASTRAPVWSRHRRRVCRNPRWWVDYRTTMKKRLNADRWRRRQERERGRERRTKRCREEEDGAGREEREKEGERRRRKDGGEEKEEEKKEEKEEVEKPQRPRRKMVGPPIRYLLESEELSYGPLTANQDGAKGFKQGRKPQKKSKAGGGASGDTAVIDRPEDTEHTERQAGQTVTETQTGHMVTEREKALLPGSTRDPDWSRHRRRVRRNPQWWVDYRTTMKKRLDTDRWRRRQEIDGGRGRRTKRCREEEEEMKAVCLKEDNGGAEGERRRRRDGGKEEEEEEKKEEKEEVEQPQRPRRKMVGPPIRYLLESEELSYRPLTANQDGAKGFKQGRNPQKKSKAGGGASGDTAVIDSPEDTEHTERQAGHMIPERQTGSYRWIRQVCTDLQSSQVTVTLPCCVRVQRLL